MQAVRGAVQGGGRAQQLRKGRHEVLQEGAVVGGVDHLQALAHLVRQREALLHAWAEVKGKACGVSARARVRAVI